jgi:hypothetical protein
MLLLKYYKKNGGGCIMNFEDLTVAERIRDFNEFREDERLRKKRELSI